MQMKRSQSTLQQLKTYYAKPEVASIKHLGFQNWFMNKSHSRFFVNMVKDVESVTFTNTYIDGDLNECVLKYMENMKELSLVNLYEERTTLTKSERIAWLQQTYPKLERFLWHGSFSSYGIEEFTTFFTNNPTIEFFSFSATATYLIEVLRTQNIRVNELFLEHDYDDLMWTDNMENLLYLCKTHNCRLHLKFDDEISEVDEETVDKLVELAPYIEGLYFESLKIDNFAHIWAAFNRLKVLQAYIFENADHFFNISSLEEIYHILP